MPADLTSGLDSRAFATRAQPAPGRLPFPTRVLKASLDRIGAVALIVLFAPLLLVVALLLRFQQGGPILFSHPRVGKDGKVFACLKFRTMRTDAAEILQMILASDPIAREEWETSFKLDHDPRVTRLGAWLRKTSLDELPQLWNVLKGEMSLVGPRPITEAEAPLYGRFMGHYKAIRPGLTGLWQVSGRSNLSYDERVSLDMTYIRGANFLWDLQIIAKTALIVLVRRGAI